MAVMSFKNPQVRVNDEKNCSCLERQSFMEGFITDVHSATSDVRGNILSQLADSCASAVEADSHVLYLLDGDHKNLWKYGQHPSKPVNMQLITEGSTIACYVACTKETIRTTRLTGDERFPNGIGIQDTTSYSVLCQPIIQPSGDLTGVMELIRVIGMPAFTEKDEQIVNSYLTWGGIVLYYAEMYHTMHKQRKLNEFLLNVTKSIFQDIVSMDTVIMKIMNFAQTLVDADRTSLFLVDTKTNELYARIFDIGTGLDTKLQKEIRFPKSKGVAGHVASTGETLNIINAYDDARFNRDVDIQTGYTTRTLLCMPIFIRGNIIGVVQMVNKRNGVFTAGDEKAFQTFAVYCGLALHHAKLYDKIRRSEQKYKVALEVLSYHSMCSEQEMTQMKQTSLGVPYAKIYEDCAAVGPQISITSLEKFGFNAYDFDDIQMAHLAVNMFDELFREERFDMDVVSRFILTVRKNYRRVPYHNWTHAFNVAHCMFCCIKFSEGHLSGLEAIALYVACLCHDLDHRGKNNDWMKNEATPLAAVYTTSTLEHHHFNQTITILQHEGHNIFGHLSSSEYKQVLGFIKDCILATDLATFFGNKARLTEIVSNEGFQVDNQMHRKLLRAVAMTGGDLSACAKPWQIQYETVKVIFQEFYAQGDEEKALGRTPLPMMDRNTADKLPQHQIGFLVGICIPCYDLLFRIMPGCKPLVDGAKKNLAKWKDMLSKSNEEREQSSEKEKNYDNKDEKGMISDGSEKSVSRSSSLDEREVISNGETEDKSKRPSSGKEKLKSAGTKSKSRQSAKTRKSAEAKKKIDQ
ncbi:probable 3',5'-cyclic phosphodiesterase pde-5 isoform X2 [Rhopilema esculentum]|uniref:probable 3',5'-cyclic phosphodiesterase pde-5 isoform X2 n=1 Tax=Rhopilema esculentum TaxID=499914 RepID=UPI0031DE97C7